MSARRLILEEDPSGTEPGHEWQCNACPFRTTDVERAQEHAAAYTQPFIHIVYEREVVEEGKKAPKPKRRISADVRGHAIVERKV